MRTGRCAPLSCSPACEKLDKTTPESSQTSDPAKCLKNQTLNPAQITVGFTCTLNSKTIENQPGKAPPLLGPCSVARKRDFLDKTRLGPEIDAQTHTRRNTRQHQEPDTHAPTLPKDQRLQRINRDTHADGPLCTAFPLANIRNTRQNHTRE